VQSTNFKTEDSSLQKVASRQLAPSPIKESGMGTTGLWDVARCPTAGNGSYLRLGRVKLYVGWAENHERLKFYVISGTRQVRKNTRFLSVTIRVGYGYHPQVKNRPRTQPHRVGYPTGTQYPYPNCHPCKGSIFMILIVLVSLITTLCMLPWSFTLVFVP
jgi:hypothetical protein